MWGLDLNWFQEWCRYYIHVAACLNPDQRIQRIKEDQSINLLWTYPM